MSVGLCFISDVITFDPITYTQVNTQIRAVWLIELEICSKPLRNLSEKLRENFPYLPLANPLGFTLMMLSLELLSWKQAH